MSNEEQLIKFRETFHMTRVTVYNDYMVYGCKKGLAKSICTEANELIKNLDLDLTAIPTTLSANDSFVIQPQFMQL